MVCALAPPAPRRRWHRQFLALLPQIVQHAKFAFRHLRGEARQDAIQETIANALVAFVALVRRGKMSLAYPTVLARYAVAQIKDRRRVEMPSILSSALALRPEAETLPGRSPRPLRSRRPEMVRGPC